jgi:hypothetical protein
MLPAASIRSRRGIVRDYRVAVGSVQQEQRTESDVAEANDAFFLTLNESLAVIAAPWVGGDLDAVERAGATDRPHVHDGMHTTGSAGLKSTWCELVQRPWSAVTSECQKRQERPAETAPAIGQVRARNGSGPIAASQYIE